MYVMGKGGYMQTRNFEAAAIRAAWESISRMLKEEIARDSEESHANKTRSSSSRNPTKGKS
jgi:hypothetical protein